MSTSRRLCSRASELLRLPNERLRLPNERLRLPNERLRLPNGRFRPPNRRGQRGMNSPWKIDGSSAEYPMRSQAELTDSTA